MRPHLERFAEHCAAAECRLRALAEVRGITPGTLLDVGAGSGAFVRVARLWGWVAEGLEPNAAMVRRARASGIPLRTGSWRRVRGPRDVITLHDVIEHLLAPEACLRRLRRCLAPGGMLVIETPEWREDRSLEWRHLRPREHLCLFSERALRVLLRRCGFDTAPLALRVRRPVQDKLAIYASTAPLAAPPPERGLEPPQRPPHPAARALW
jgi:2-polyprenyl-3-methyl-5-hydroxy-6-metoxy-1,4-benzoquinol methylase